MRHAILLGFAVALAASADASCATTAPPADSSVAAELRRRTQELMDAVAPGNAEVWRRWLHEDAIYLDENGKRFDKAALLADLTPLPPGLVGSIAVDRFEARIEGDVAVAAVEIQESLDYHGQHLGTRFRFLDTWIRERGEWLLLARHTAAVLRDPPAIRLPRETLCGYAGTYRLTAEITTVLRCSEAGLESERTGRPPATFLPETADVFFQPGQPRTRRIFLRDAVGRVVAFVDRREGEDVRWERIAAPATER